MRSDGGTREEQDRPVPQVPSWFTRVMRATPSTVSADEYIAVTIEGKDSEQPVVSGASSPTDPREAKDAISADSTDSQSKTILSFPPNDPANPYNWSTTRKALVVFMGALTVLNSTIGSSLPSGDSPELSRHFGVTNTEELVLPISMFLVGYVLGPLLFGPLSESYGRQIVMLSTFGGLTLFDLAGCLAPDWASFIIFRLFQGIFAASPISVVGGVYADLYDNPVHRGRSLAIFMTATSVGPVAGPIISGYLGAYSWNWPYWFALIFAGLTWVMFAFLPETYGETILQRRAKKIRKANPGANVYAAIDFESKTWNDIITNILARPVRMFYSEALVFFTCIYLSLIYAVFYMFFQAFPLIYPPIYGFSLGEEGLAFIPVAIGASIACCIYLWWDYYLQKAKDRGAAWSSIEEYRRLPLALIGGPALTIGMFWIGWSARPSVHWIVPMIGTIPFGVGFLLLFMSLLNYLVDAYQVWAASALAASTFTRSLFGAVLPFAALPMFKRLGIAWACSLLGFLSLAMCVIPFAFIRYGSKIRAHSKFCRELEEQNAAKNSRLGSTDEDAAQNDMTKQQSREEKV